MTDKPKSRAFDPSFEPTKTWADLAREFPDNPGIKMLAERDAALIAQAQKGNAGEEPDYDLGPDANHKSLSEMHAAGLLATRGAQQLAMSARYLLTDEEDPLPDEGGGTND